MIQAELLLNGRAVQSGAVDNATATATAVAVTGVRHFVSGIDADYIDATVTSYKTITLKFGTTTIFVWRWDFAKGPFIRNLPVPVHGDYNQAVSVELEASGVGGKTGRVGFWVSDS
jgi:hypothetical protein